MGDAKAVCVKGVQLDQKLRTKKDRSRVPGRRRYRLAFSESDRECLCETLTSWCMLRDGEKEERESKKRNKGKSRMEL